MVNDLHPVFTRCFVTTFRWAIKKVKTHYPFQKQRLLMFNVLFIISICERYKAYFLANLWQNNSGQTIRKTITNTYINYQIPDREKSREKSHVNFWRHI